MKIFFAGAEGHHEFRTLLMEGVECVLLTFQYLRQKSTAEQDSMLRDFYDAETSIIIDSGAHTFFKTLAWFNWAERNITDDRHRAAAGALGATHKEYIDHKLESVYAYFKEYLDFCNRVHHFVDYFSELDVQGPVPREQVIAWRQELSHLPLIVTHHGAWDESLIDEFADYDYIGLPRGVGKKPEDYIRIIDMLGRDKVYHGWAATKRSLLRKVPFYSVDSTTWLAGSRFKALYRYHGGLKISRLIDGPHSSPEKREAVFRQIAKEAEEKGIILDDLRAMQFEALDRWNTLEWKKLAEDARTTKYKDEYWLTDKERKDIFALKRKGVSAHVEQTALAIQEQSTALEVREKLALDKRTAVSRFCDTCPLNEVCPVYEPHAACKLTSVPQIDNAGHAGDALRQLLALQVDRLHHGAMTERLTGQYFPSMSEEMELAARMAKYVAEMEKMQAKDSITLEAEGEAGVNIMGMLLSNLSRPTGRSSGDMGVYSRRNARAEVREESRKKTEVIEAEFEDSQNDTTDSDRARDEDES